MRLIVIGLFVAACTGGPQATNGVATVDPTQLSPAPSVKERPTATTTPSSPWGDGPIVGEAIAFISSTYDVFVIAPDGSNLRNVSNDPRRIDSGPSWSPDGREIALAFEGNSNLHVIDANSGEIEVIDTNLTGDAYGPSWSPDGTRIAFNLFGPDGASIYVIDREGSVPMPLYEPTGTSACCVDWSPDGTQMVFVEGSNDSESDIIVMNADGSGRTRLTDEPGADSSPRWSPDGSRVAFFSDRGGGGVFTVNPDGTDTQPVSGNPLEARIGWLDWSPDGNRLAFLGEFAGEGNLGSPLYVFDVDDPEYVQLTETDATGSPISWRGAP